jgi:guanylate kinase
MQRSGPINISSTNSRDRVINPLIVLFGSSGAGKTHWKNWFIYQGLVPVRSLTSRPQRSSEEYEYLFVPKTIFLQRLKDRELFNVNEYHDEWYGTSLEVFWKAFGAARRKDTALVMISDITSLARLNKELHSQKILIPNVTPLFVECKPRSDYAALLKARGTPERVSVAKKEVEEFQKQQFGVEIFATISDELDAQGVLERVTK